MITLQLGCGLRAVDDYAAARCLLLNFLVEPGLTMGAQAIEKLLKSYILQKDRNFNIKTSNHDLSKSLKTANELSGNDLDEVIGEIEPILKRFEVNYDRRYLREWEERVMSSAEIIDSAKVLICLVKYIMDNSSLSDEEKYNNRGFYLTLNMNICSQNPQPERDWIVKSNRFPASSLPKIVEKYKRLNNLN